jgi:hypothetical protein
MREHKPGIYGAVDDKGRDIAYTYSIDWARMVELARKAARNKSHQATAGPITITAELRHYGPGGPR